MVMMTAKVNKKRVILVLAALAALIVLICILAKGGGGESPAPSQEQPVSVATNDAVALTQVKCATAGVAASF